MKKIYTKELVSVNNSLIKELSILKKHRKNLETQLFSIQNARAYKYWQILNTLKNSNNIFEFRNLLIKKLFSNRKLLSIKNQKKYIKKINLKNDIKKYKISVIIPTYNAEPFLKPLMKAILAQKNIEDLEIIIVDSESEDNTKQIAKNFGAKVITVKRKDFNHGLARNIGANRAKHELLLFTVQDALPKNNKLFAEMAELIQKDEQIAAVSTIQNPRPDADLFARWQVNNHNELLKLDYNFISYTGISSDFKNESFILKRRISLLDNVCSLYKKSIFIKQSNFKKITFGEDLDYALRALNSDYRLGLLCTNGVIHSHNRSALYFLKRTFLSSLVDLKLLSEIDIHKNYDPSKGLMLGIILAEYFYFSNKKTYNKDTNNLIKFSNNFLNSNFEAKPFSVLGKIFTNIANKMININKQISITNVENYYFELITILENYLNKHPDLIFDNSDKRGFLEKMLASRIGNLLAKYCLGKQSKIVIKNKKILINLLSGNV